MMKTLIFLFAIIFTGPSWAQDESDSQNVSSLDQTIKSLPNVGNPPSLTDCDCDGEEDKEEKKPKRKERPLISFSFSVGGDNDTEKRVSSYDCSSSPRIAEIVDIVDQLPNMNREDYKRYVAGQTQHFSAQDKICLGNKFASVGSSNYTMADGIGFYSLDEMHSCMQQSAQGNYESCRTCAPIHHYGADMLESMGAKCGLMVNQIDSPDLDSAGNMSGSTRFMHYVNICKLDGRFYMLNYNDNYQLDAMTYQEAIDIANVGLAEGNWGGNQITCLDPGKNPLSECKHVYLSRSTRYQLSKIKEAVSQMNDVDSPIHVALSNMGQEIRAAGIFQTTSTNEKQKDGDLEQYEANHGFVGGYHLYGGEHFGHAGYVFRTNTAVTGEKSLIGPKRESFQDLYVGIAGSRGNGSLYIPGGMQDYYSLVIYYNREDLYRLDEKNDIRMQYHLVAGSDIENLTKPGDNAGLGLTDVIIMDYDHKFNEILTGRVSQEFSILTDKTNLPTFYLGKTSLTLLQEFYKDNPDIDLTNETSIHFLHGGFSDETFAFQNTTELTMKNRDPMGMSLSMSADLGYTTDSVMGRDIFYDKGFFAEGNMSIVQPLLKKGYRSLYLQFDGGFTTGQRPAQFAIDPLIIEKNPTRNQVEAGMNGFIRLGGSF